MKSGYVCAWCLSSRATYQFNDVCVCRVCNKAFPLQKKVEPTREQEDLTDPCCKECGVRVPVRYRYESPTVPVLFTLEVCDRCFVERHKNKKMDVTSKVVYGLLMYVFCFDVGIFLVGQYHSRIIVATTGLLIYLVLLLIWRFIRGYPLHRAKKELAKMNRISASAECDFREIKRREEEREKHQEQYRKQLEESRLQYERIRSSGIETIDQMSGVDFEVRMKHMFEALGYSVKTTRVSGDQGADLIMKRDNKKIAVQCKRYESSVGNAAVKDVLAGMAFYGCNEGWVLTNSYFTTHAKSLAKKSGVKLIDRDELIELLHQQQEIEKQQVVPL